MKTRSSILVTGALAAVLALAVVTVPALALDPYDAPKISCVSSGENQITIKICADASGTGAPAGISIQWKKRSDWEVSGWSDENLCALSLSGQPSMQHPGKSRWELVAGECEEVKIGDINFDETGVGGDGCALDALECGEEYVFRAFAHAGRRMGRSAWSADLFCSTQPCPGSDCTYTQGFWKTHGPPGCQTGNNTNVWPVASLTLGTVNYNQSQLCSILNKPAQGNGLVSLAHQLIAAKFNLATGATACPAVVSAIAAADGLIGSLVVPPVGGGQLAPSATSSVANTLDDFNNGNLGGCPSHCPSATGPRFGLNASSTEVSPWGTIKARYR